MLYFFYNYKNNICNGKKISEIKGEGLGQQHNIYYSQDHSESIMCLCTYIATKTCYPQPFFQHFLSASDHCGLQTIGCLMEWSISVLDLVAIQTYREKEWISFSSSRDNLTGYARPKSNSEITMAIFWELQSSTKTLSVHSSPDFVFTASIFLNFPKLQRMRSKISECHSLLKLVTCKRWRKVMMWKDQTGRKYAINAELGAGNIFKNKNLDHSLENLQLH